MPRVGTGTVDGRCYVTSSLRRDRANNGAEKEPNFLGRVLLAAADVTAALKEDDHKLQKRTAMSHVGGRVKIRTQVGRLPAAFDATGKCLRGDTAIDTADGACDAQRDA